MTGIDLVRNFVVRILDSNGVPVGIGTLVAQNRVLTCAHVVEAAIRSTESDLLDSVSNVVYCDMPLIAHNTKPTFRTKVTILRPPAPTQQLGDLAVLEVQEGIARTATEAQVGAYSDLWGAKYLAFGCPRGQEDGVWTTGLVRAEQASGLVLLESDSLAGYDLGPGFSGGPVWHPESESVIGIVKGAETDPRPRTGFMIPIRAVVQTWPMLARVALRSSEPATSANSNSGQVTIKVFLHAGEDVEDEKGIATRVIERLGNDPFIQDIANVRLITWDSPSALQSAATQSYTPEAASLRGIPNPSECDLMVCIIWNNLGSVIANPDSDKGSRLVEWLLANARGKLGNRDADPDIFLYSRKKPLLLDPDAADFAGRLEEHRKTISLVAKAKTDKRYIVQEFESASSFETDLEIALRKYVRKIIGDKSAKGEGRKSSTVSSRAYATLLTPYPGLRAFQPSDEAVFFGRGKEVDHLLDMLQDGENCFTIVGPSGVGKTSLVYAGMLARLRRNSVVGSKDWPMLKLRPADIGDDAIVPLAIGLADLLPETRARDVADRLRSDPESLNHLLGMILESRPSWAKLVIFVDQMEELYSLCTPESAENLLLSLSSIAARTDTLLVSTLRADYTARYLEQPLVSGVKGNIVALGAPTREALFDMITRPAAWAGVEFEKGLPEIIQRDVGQGLGALPLMAYALEALFRRSADNGVFSYGSYEAVGGVKGAIGMRASKVTSDLTESQRKSLSWIFAELTEIDRKGMAIRKKAPISKLESRPEAKSVVEAFAQARLLTMDAPSSGREATFELGHEALLEHWNELSVWLDKRWSQHLQAQSSTARESEMGRRRKLASPRLSSGRAFPAGVRPEDGRYCWTIVDRQLFENVLASVRWHQGRTPGMQTQRVNISESSDELPVVFRLRGMNQMEFRKFIYGNEPMIVEYWPNSTQEGFRGITFVNRDRSRWRQDLVPSAGAPIFVLKLRDGQLWLERINRSNGVV